MSARRASREAGGRAGAGDGAAGTAAGHPQAHGEDPAFHAAKVPPGGSDRAIAAGGAARA
jgi:hypothetical protein